MANENKEVKIVPPEGYTIDEENSTFECIKFKPIQKPKFSDYNGEFTINGFWIGASSKILVANSYCNSFVNRGMFATEKQAKSALAMAQISQIMANDERFGGPITDEEWKLPTYKYVVRRIEDTYDFYIYQTTYQFLAFHTKEQRDLFLQENKQLVKDYLMVD